ncbi:hypothetical protein CDL12_12352 [Handroanthus impetiginosus]|uniref:Uncharacterized protein n=1 Tax=Handroanthus impetiginosus TaxID=429701 RepID=A0A2G9HBW5_9LAMI|nr:hypothetical protein CDL12_12352 [Handroanthus impetiginosus]
MEDDKQGEQSNGHNSSVGDENDLSLDFAALLSNSSQLDPKLVGNLVFRTPEEADWFYWNYGRQNGFDIRRCHKKIKGSLVKNAEWVCSRAGFKKPPKYVSQRKRRSRKETRCGCEARFRVAHDRYDGLYKVTDFVPFHNHPLETIETAHRLRCNRHLRPSEKNLLSGMTSAGISPSKAMDYLEYIEGGPGKVAFRRKDVYNYLNKQRMQMIKDGDVNTALSLLDGMKLHDKGMIFEYTVDEEQTLTRLFWTDGLSRAEFDLFGDVLMFDSTYKTNTYCFPLVIMCGVNNHFSTCVFGAALLYNETIESYQWLLQKFRDAMGGKMPISVLTDQDAAMHAAIEIEFPFARHRICSWHLERNAMQNTHMSVFACDMGLLLKKNYSIEEFDSSWLSITERHGLTEFLKQYHICIQKIRATFFQNQEDCENSTPSLLNDSLRTFEKHAVSVYTKKVFELVSKEIRKEQDMVLEEATNDDSYMFTFKFGSYPKVGDKRFSVKIDWAGQNFQCDCEKLESVGIPCRHLISAFKVLRLEEIPKKCIEERWTIAIGKKLVDKFSTSFPFEDEQRRRFAILNRECASLCLQSSQSDPATFKSVKCIRDLAQELENENLMNAIDRDGAHENQKLPIVKDPKRIRSSKNVHDPKKIRSRGVPKAKQQNCGKCGEPGHKANTCTRNSRKLDGRHVCSVNFEESNEASNMTNPNCSY